MLYRVDRVLQSSSSWDRLLDLCNCDSYGICAFNKKLLESLKSKFNNFSLEFIPVDLTQFHHLTPWCEKFWDSYAR